MRGPLIPSCLENFLNCFYNRLLPTLLTGVFLAVLWMGGQLTELRVHDLFMRWSAQPATHSPVTLILIDDDSLNRLRSRFGPPPWSRNRYQSVFQAVQAANPAVMVFDSFYVDEPLPDKPSFSEEAIRFPHLITGFALEALKPDIHFFQRLKQSLFQSQSVSSRYGELSYLMQGNLRLGVINVNEDADGVIRSIYPLFHSGTQFGGKTLRGLTLPALSLAAMNDYFFFSEAYLQVASTGLSHSKVVAPGHVARGAFQGKTQTGISLSSAQAFNQQVSGLPLLVNDQGALNLRWQKLMTHRFSEPARSHLAIPLWHFFDNRYPKPDLSGRIALIGSSSMFYRDYHKTPMANRHLGSDIHATAIDNLLMGQTVRKVPGWLNFMMLVLLCPAIFLIRVRYPKISRTMLYTLGSMVIYSWLAYCCFALGGWWLDVLTPLLFMTVAFIAGSTYRICKKEKQLAHMEKNLSQLVDPEVFREIRRLSHVLAPGGQKLEITSMFVDIRDFTRLAEHLQPNELTELLNEFYGETVKIIFSHQGTIDKFMGDGILIIFGAPLPNVQHRRMALQAGAEILSVTGQLCQRWRQTLGIDTEIGITLNSGPAFVGFLGPANKLEYTGVGDTVNTCIRLQEQTRPCRTRFIISESTLIELADVNGLSELPSPYLSLGEVRIRGREGTLRIFTVSEALSSTLPMQGQRSPSALTLEEALKV